MAAEAKAIFAKFDGENAAVDATDLCPQQQQQNPEVHQRHDRGGKRQARDSEVEEVNHRIGRHVSSPRSKARLTFMGVRASFSA